MSRNGWLPSAYQDEIIPPVRDTPDAWIVSLDDGAPALDAAEPRRRSRKRVVAAAPHQGW